MKGPYIPSVGEKFSRWTVIGPGFRRGENWYCRCRCECGNEADVRALYLRNSHSKSCGCITRTAKARSHSTEYIIWKGIVKRCKEHPRYRALGVCERWRVSFDAFLSDMGLRPSLRHSVDRIDNERGYEPNNCRWATPTQQSRNKNDNLLITVGGRTMCVADWCDEVGMSKKAVYWRLKRGWTAEEALTVPVRRMTRG